MTQKTSKVLLSSVCAPFGMEYGDGFGASYEGTHQIMWAQGIFRVRATTTQWGIDFIAHNLSTPTVTLHYPSMSRFIKEIKKGYTHIGIAFISATMHKMIPMISAIRKYAPRSKIVLGGYGTAIGDEIKRYADYVCQGEGVAFMRELLGERIDAPITQPDITQKQKLFSLPLQGKTGYVFGGLGCPNGCDFCATSHYFKRKHISFLPDGRSILGAIEKLREKHPGMNKFWINDEDFLLNETRGRGFLDAIRHSHLPPLSLSCFSSVKALSKYKPEELVEMGIDWIWVGYEGKRAGYAKMKGISYKELFESLRECGISVLASMIIGFDYQTREIIEEEFAELMELRPSMSQFLIYGPSPGTPLQKRLEKEGRLDPVVMKSRYKHDGFTLGFKHPHISRKEMSEIQRTLYKDEFRLLGPSVFRVVDDMLTGYNNLKEHSDTRIRNKSNLYKQSAHDAMMLIPGSLPFVDSCTGDYLDDLYQRIEASTGKLTIKEKLMEKAVRQMIRLTSYKLNFNLDRQPEFSRREFNMNSIQHKHAQTSGTKLSLESVGHI